MNTFNLKLKHIEKRIYSFKGNLDDELNLLEEMADIFISYGDMFSVEMNDLLDITPQRKYMDLNIWMQALNVKKMDILFSSAILRYSFSIKNNLPCWNDFFMTVWNICENKDELYGLK